VKGRSLEVRLGSAIREWVPPGALRAAAGLYPFGYKGRYASWADAKAASRGYDAPVILERARTATEAARNGAGHERDGVLLKAGDYPYPAVAYLLDTALKCGGRLKVLDFGGALGGMYFNCRTFFRGCSPVLWTVVDQPAQVECGRRHFETEELRFQFSLADAVRDGLPDVVLCSSVLQYLEHPFQWIEQVFALGVERLLIMRTPFICAPVAEITVQRVPPRIYPASFPSWLFSERQLLEFMQGRYDLVAQYDEEWFYPSAARFKGFFFQRCC
jgi:putative methyltransferase (TIGR04325 family)